MDCARYASVRPSGEKRGSPSAAGLVVRGVVFPDPRSSERRSRFVLQASIRAGTGSAVWTSARPSGVNAYSSPASKVLDVGTASRSPGVTSRGAPADPSPMGTTKRCCLRPPVQESQWR